MEKCCHEYTNFIFPRITQIKKSAEKARILYSLRKDVFRITNTRNESIPQNAFKFFNFDLRNLSNFSANICGKTNPFFHKSECRLDLLFQF